MLDLESDAQVGWTHRQTSSRSKVRDSCHSCAMSKVKCPKEKPSCSKCELRGITCQYLFAKRSGRRRENSTANSTSSNSNTNADTESSRSWEMDINQAMQPSLGACFLSGSTITPTSLSGANSYLRTPPTWSVPPSPRPDNVFAADSDLFSVLGKTGMFPELADFSSEVNDMDNTFGLPGMDSGSITQTRHEIGSLLIPAERVNLDHASSHTSSAVDILSASPELSSLASNVELMSAGETSMTRITDTSSCACLTQALDLLKLHSLGQFSPCATFPSPVATATPNTINVGSVQTVLRENKQSIEIVSSKLACSSCAGDSFLLTVISMIVLKILERYAAAARALPHATGTSEAEAGEAEAGKATRLPNSIISGGGDWTRALSSAYNAPCNDKDRGRVAAQLVLSELHRVQRLLNQLSPKLKGPKEGEGRNLGPELESWGRPKVTGEGDKMTMTPFSASTLDQMERDVRKSLSTLSAEIINQLRQS